MLKRLLRTARRWYFDTPERALDQAYRSALAIRALEEEYFAGDKVDPAASAHSERVTVYCDTEVKKNLKFIRLRLAEFNTASSLVDATENLPSYHNEDTSYYESEVRDRAAVIVEKLAFIDQVVARYEPPSPPVDSKSLVPLAATDNGKSTTTQLQPAATRALWQNGRGKRSDRAIASPLPEPPINTETITDKTGVLPRSILNTFQRIRREIDPQSQASEQEVLKKFRQSRNRTAISIKFLLLLIIVPLLTHQLTKTFLVVPLVDRYFPPPENELLFLNQDIQDEALSEFRRYEETLHFTALLGQAPQLSEPEINANLQTKAEEIAERFQHRGVDAIANVFADIFSLIAFSWVLLNSREEIAIVKSFLDEIIYGLSDSAKSFLIILFTDMFVGFHSPHGWEVILEGISRHFGLPESRDFNFLFIATFPVILDTVLKYWIFRYLNRISPSAVATYKTMNE
ncbi:MAG: proton extrusion protein PcxA [Spirulinaceae cyanobacterium RM2_2_10]|nr:proton extrusion protein PcxA [Spirulinaceae cyanobacterium SM2_1_0]NJO20649.1 proton extrusion protein PcxA [Spirulinaceae cyanobacterium RM2_2_10]